LEDEAAGGVVYVEDKRREARSETREVDGRVTAAGVGGYEEGGGRMEE
jgi:hypothetical protein